MKKILSILLALVMIFALVACGESKTDDKKDDSVVAYVIAEKGDTYSLGLANNFKTSFEGLGGTVIMETFPANTTNFSDYIQKALDNNADVIFCPNSTAVASNFIKNAQDLGVECPIMAGDTWESSVILEAAKGCDFEVFCSTFFDENDSTSSYAKDFVSGFKSWLNANADKKAMNGGNDIVAAVSALAFDGYNVAMAAIRAAAAEKGSALTSVDIAKALCTLKYEEAVTGTIQFNEIGDAIKDAAYIKKAADGKFEFVTVQKTTNLDAPRTTAIDYTAEGVALDTVNKTIVIGVYEPTSGANGAGGKQEVLGAMYANALDDVVTIDGVDYKVELYVSDNESSEDKAVTAASAIVNQGALVALGSYGSGVSIAAAETFAGAAIPAIGLSCTNTSVTEGHDYYFRICFLDPFQGGVMASFAWEKIGK